MPIWGAGRDVGAAYSLVNHHGAARALRAASAARHEHIVARQVHFPRGGVD